MKEGGKEGGRGSEGGGVKREGEVVKEGGRGSEGGRER